MIGLILAGGKNLMTVRDMTTNVLPNGLNMVELAYRKLTEIGLTTYLSVEPLLPGDLPAYGDMQLIINQKGINATGPLLGLLSAHRKFPMDDIFVLACNMPFMKISCLYHLFDLWLERISEINVYQKGGRAEPFCGIYSYDALRQIARLVSDKQKSHSSLQYFVQRLNTCYMHIPKEDEVAFLNIRTQNQLELLCKTQMSNPDQLLRSNAAYLFQGI